MHSANFDHKYENCFVYYFILSMIQIEYKKLFFEILYHIEIIQYMIHHIVKHRRRNGRYFLLKIWMKKYLVLHYLADLRQFKWLELDDMPLMLIIHPVFTYSKFTYSMLPRDLGKLVRLSFAASKNFSDVVKWKQYPQKKLSSNKHVKMSSYVLTGNNKSSLCT